MTHPTASNSAPAPAIRPGSSGITLRGIARETSGALRGQKVAFAMILLLVAAMCAVVVVTTGRAQAAGRQVAAQVEAAGSRVLIITDQGGNDLVTAPDLTVLASTQGIQSAIGLGVARDVTVGSIGPGGTPVAAWPVLGSLLSIVTLTEGRWPNPGEALVSAAGQQQLGLDSPIGWVSDNHGFTASVVGSYRPLPGYGDLDGVLIAQTASVAPTLRLVVADISAVHAAQSLALNVLAPRDPSKLQITSPSALAELQQALSGDLEAYTRTLTVVTLAAATVLIAIVVLSQVLLQRRDIGRRRALGAPRWAVITLVIAQTTVPSAIGAVFGTVGATLIATHTGSSPDFDLPLAALILGVLAAALAAVPPATLAAWRDPVRVLRTP